MELYVAIGILVLAVFLFFIYIKDAYFEKKISIPRIVFSGTIIVAALLYLIVFYPMIKGNEKILKILDYVFYGIFVLEAIAYFLVGYKGVTSKFLYKEYLKIVENDRIYILLDKNDRIKALSKSVMDTMLNYNKKVIGQNFFVIFDSMYRVCQVNDQPFSNKDLRKMFFMLNEQTKSTVIKREIKVYDTENKPLIISLNDYVICENGKYMGHILLGEEHSLDTMLNVEAKLKDNEENLDNIRLKFQAQLELTSEAIMFYNIDKGYIWANDIFVAMLHLNENTISYERYLSLIHPSEVEYYKSTIASLTASKPNYEIRFRLLVGASYIYVCERGKRLFDSSSSEIISYLDVINSNHYERSNIPELDNVKSVSELAIAINSLYKQARTFQLVTFRIDNIKDLNDEYGRDMGNMVMAEYMKAIIKNFVDEGMIYRVSGLEFSFIITDYRKMDILSRALKKDDKLLKASMKYGSDVITTNVYMGIALSSDVANATQLIEAARKSLKTALLDQVSTNYIYYKDIK